MAKPMRFSASSAARLMACPGSANLEEAIPGFEHPPPNSNGRKGKGSEIHDLLEQIVNLPNAEVGKLIEAQQYVHELRKTRRFKVLTEFKTTATWLPSLPSTTVDLILYVQDEIHIIDWKAGAIHVDAADNMQLMFYARTYAGLAPKAPGVWVHIVQPWSKEGSSSAFLSAADLNAFTIEAVATDKAITAHDLTLAPSDNCTFCPANPHSRGDKGTKMCPKMMQLLYPDPLDEEDILAGLED